MVEVEISSDLIEKAMTNADVRKHLQVVADRVANRARRIAANEGVEMNVTTTAGTRPGGRPYVNVLGDNPDQEWGSSWSEKFRILGRAAESG